MSAPRFGSITPFFEMAGDEAKGLLYGLMESNKIQLTKYPDMPSIRSLVQEGKIRYERSDPNEHWQTYRELCEKVRRDGSATGDCEDLATAIAAEDQVRYGVSSLPFAYSPRAGLFHVVTAVPTDRYGNIPSGNWPDARGATAPPGYILQDPSAAAGMGTGFGYVPTEEVPVAYGANRGRGLGSVVRAFQEGVLGTGSAASAARSLGEGARQGSGVGEGFFRSIGEQLPGALGLGKIQPREDSAVNALKKGMASDDQPRSQRQSAPEEDEDDEDLLDEDEEFGLSVAPDASAMVGSSQWWLDRTSNQAVDSMFGGDDEPNRFKAPGWLFPALAGAGVGAAAVGIGLGLRNRRRPREAEEVQEVQAEFGGIDDLVADAMFGDDDFDDDDFGDDEESSFGNAGPSFRSDSSRGAGPIASMGSLRRTDLFGASSSEGFRFVRSGDEG